MPYFTPFFFFLGLFFTSFNTLLWNISNFLISLNVWTLGWDSFSKTAFLTLLSCRYSNYCSNWSNSSKKFFRFETLISTESRFALCFLFFVVVFLEDEVLFWFGNPLPEPLGPPLFYPPLTPLFFDLAFFAKLLLLSSVWKILKATSVLLRPSAIPFLSITLLRFMCLF